MLETGVSAISLWIINGTSWWNKKNNKKWNFEIDHDALIFFCWIFFTRDFNIINNIQHVMNPNDDSY